MKEYEMGSTYDMVGTTVTILVRKPAEWTTWTGINAKMKSVCIL